MLFEMQCPGFKQDLFWFTASLQTCCHTEASLTAKKFVSIALEKNISGEEENAETVNLGVWIFRLIVPRSAH